MRAVNPNNDTTQVCTLLKEYHNGKPWIRFDDGGVWPPSRCKPIICDTKEEAEALVNKVEAIDARRKGCPRHGQCFCDGACMPGYKERQAVSYERLDTAIQAEMERVAQKLASEQVQMDPDCAEVLNDNLWDLYIKSDLSLEPKHTDTWHQPNKRNREQAPFVVGGGV